MVRPARIVVFALLLLMLVAGAAAPAGAIPIIKDLTPDPLNVFAAIGDGDATGVAAAPDSVGYVCGSGFRFDHGTDIVIHRVGPGSWDRFWDGAAHGTDEAWDIVYSSKGAVYVAGSSELSSGDHRAVIVKYSTGGKLLWARRWNAAAGLDATARRIAIDAKGRIVVAGIAPVAGAQHVYAAKYTAGGKLLWARVYTKGALGVFKDAVLDGAGNVYVAGEWMATGAETHDGLLVKFSSAGKVAWARTFDAVGLFDTFLAVCRRPSGGVFVAGSSSTGGDDSDGIVLRYTSRGSGKVVVRHGTSDGLYNAFYDIVRTTAGKIAVCGGESDGTGPSSFVVASYTEAGAEDWYRTWASATGSSRAEILVARPDGAVAAAGFWARQGSGGPQDSLTYVINSSGVRRARNQWAGPAAGETWPRDMASRGSSVWVAGTCFSAGPDQEGYAMRLVP